MTIISSVPAIRLRVRRINEQSFAASSIANATPGKWAADTRTGGSVANKYGYPADTEGALAVVTPEGHCVVWIARLPANKVTSRGAAAACVKSAGDIFDSRVTSKERRSAAWTQLKHITLVEIAKRLPWGEATELLAPGTIDKIPVGELDS